MSQDLVLPDLTVLKESLAHRPEVVLAFLFGSYARGQARPDSDVDCAVLLAEDVAQDAYFDLRLQLSDLVGRVLGRDDIDLLVLNEAPLALAYRVLRDGQALYQRNHDTYVRYRVRVLDLYFDFAPWLERYEAMFLRRVSREGLLYGSDPYRGTSAAHQAILAALERTPKGES